MVPGKLCTCMCQAQRLPLSRAQQFTQGPAKFLKGHTSTSMFSVPACWGLRSELTRVLLASHSPPQFFNWCHLNSECLIYKSQLSLRHFGKHRTYIPASVCEGFSLNSAGSKAEQQVVVVVGPLIVEKYSKKAKLFNFKEV